MAPPRGPSSWLSFLVVHRKFSNSQEAKQGGCHCCLQHEMVVGRVLAYRDWDNSCNILMVSDCLLAVHLFPSEPSESKPQLPVPCYGALEAIGVVEV